MNLESRVNCSRCKGDLAEKISSNEINGNIDYLGEITEATVRKNLKSEIKLSKAIDQKVASFIKKVKRQSKYEMLNLEQLISSKMAYKGKPAKHYGTLTKLNKQISSEIWDPVILEEQRRMAEEKLNKGGSSQASDE